MRHTSTIAAVCLLSATALAQPAAEIGSWRLSCTTDRMTDRAACLVRHREWAEPPGTGLTGSALPGLALEVIDRGGRLVPAITSRDLGLEQVPRGLLAIAGTAQIRFPPHPLIELPCGLEGRSLICAPRGEEAARAETELPTADRALVRMTGLGGGTLTDPVELPLAGTREALARLRRDAPAGAAPPEPAGMDARELLQRLQRLLGY